MYGEYIKFKLITCLKNVKSTTNNERKCTRKQIFKTSLTSTY